MVWGLSASIEAPRQLWVKQATSALDIMRRADGDAARASSGFWPTRMMCELDAAELHPFLERSPAPALFRNCRLSIGISRGAVAEEAEAEQGPASASVNVACPRP